jgi:hypothetical protein
MEPDAQKAIYELAHLNDIKSQERKNLKFTVVYHDDTGTRQERPMASMAKLRDKINELMPNENVGGNMSAKNWTGKHLPTLISRAKTHPTSGLPIIQLSKAYIQIEKKP